MTVRPIIAMTMGDAAGVGPEVIMKSLAHAELYAQCRPLVIGDAERLRQAGHIVGSALEVRSLSVDEVDKNLQITIYHMAARANGYKDREMLLRFDCLIKTKACKFEQYYTTRSEMDEMRALKKIRHVWEGISKRVFIPNDSWRCKGCSYKNACDEWFMKEDQSL